MIGSNGYLNEDEVNAVTWITKLLRGMEKTEETLNHYKG